jgi:hypothetical protein
VGVMGESFRRGGWPSGHTGVSCAPV